MKSLRPRGLLALASLALAGCHAEPFRVEFNARTIEYERLESVEVPEDAHVDRVEAHRLVISGDTPVTINGREVYADEDGIRLAQRILQLAPADRLFIDRLGEVHLRTPSGHLGPSPSGTSVAQAPRASSPTRVATARSANPPQEETSLWSFFR